MRRAKVVYRPEALGDLRQIYIDIADIGQSHESSVITPGVLHRQAFHGTKSE